MGVKDIDIGADTNPTPSHLLVDHLVKKHGFRSPERCQRYFQRILGDVRLYDRDVLEITAGPGWVSLFAASQGANLVFTVAATERDQVRLGSLAAEAELLGLDQVEVATRPFSTQDIGTLAFDVVVLRASVTWLDPESSWTLENDSSSRTRYEEIWQRIWEATRPGAQVVIFDVSRRNLWPSLGLRNPFARDTDWERHPPPSVWTELLQDTGFEQPEVEWMVPAPLETMSRALPAGVAAHAVRSRYRLTVRRP